MRWRLWPALTLAIALAACASRPVQAPGIVVAPGPDRAAVAQATQRAADQIKRCYRHPRVIRAARAISTTLLVRYAVDGTLIGLPQMVRQTGITPENAVQARLMAEAASFAVVRCQPVSLPPELHDGGWDEFELTFSPGGAA